MRNLTSMAVPSQFRASARGDIMSVSHAFYDVFAREFKHNKEALGRNDPDALAIVNYRPNKYKNLVLIDLPRLFRESRRSG